jgi:hypothetical protein
MNEMSEQVLVALQGLAILKASLQSKTVLTDVPGEEEEGLKPLEQ